MRLNARTGVGLLVVVIGLGLIVIAAMGSSARIPGTLRPAPEIPIASGSVAPLDPMSGVHRSNPLVERRLPTNSDPTKATIFDSAYGDRGKHDVTVSITSGGRMGYLINWRGGKTESGKASSVHRSRVISGGFPVVQVVAQAAPPGTLTCTITVDGARKTVQSSTQAYRPLVCVG